MNKEETLPYFTRVKNLVVNSKKLSFKPQRIEIYKVQEPDIEFFDPQAKVYSLFEQQLRIAPLDTTYKNLYATFYSYGHMGQIIQFFDPIKRIEYTSDFMPMPVSKLVGNNNVIVVKSVFDYITLLEAGFSTTLVSEINAKNFEAVVDLDYYLSPLLLGDLIDKIVSGQPRGNFYEFIQDIDYFDENATSLMDFLGKTSVERSVSIMIEKSKKIIKGSSGIVDSKFKIEEEDNRRGYSAVIESDKGRKSFPICNFTVKYKKRIKTNEGFRIVADVNGGSGVHTRNVYIDPSIYSKPDKFVEFFSSLDDRYTVKIPAISKIFTKNDVLIKLKDYLVGKFVTPITLELSRTGYDVGLRTNIFPDWVSSIGKDASNTSESVLGSFKIVESYSGNYPDLRHIEMREPDEDYSRFVSMAREAFFESQVDGDIPFLIAFSFALASFYAPLIFRDIKHFPILNLNGNKGSGKTFLTEFISECFGMNPTPTGAGETTIPSLVRIMNQHNSGFMVLDEMTKGSTREDFKRYESVLRVNYDGGQRMISSRNTDYGVTKQKIAMPIVVVGESELGDPAVRSRSIMVNMPDYEQQGSRPYTALELIDLTVGFRPYLKNFIANVSEVRWQNIYRKRFDHIKKALLDKGSTRQVFSYSLILAFMGDLLGRREYKKVIDVVGDNILAKTVSKEYDDVLTVINICITGMLADRNKGRSYYRDCFGLDHDDHIRFRANVLFGIAKLYDKSNVMVLQNNIEFSQAIKNKKYYGGDGKYDSIANLLDNDRRSEYNLESSRRERLRMVKIKKNLIPRELNNLLIEVNSDYGR